MPRSTSGHTTTLAIALAVSTPMFYASPVLAAAQPAVNSHQQLESAATTADAPAPAVTVEDTDDLGEMVVLGTAEQTLKQAPGVSIITSEDIEKRPPANDLSEIIRRMPGVNLTGNSASGQRGNNRQIDIRGMGPENTLILIDGKPVSSRNSVRYGWRGERDSRGDTNWVPPEMVERIEVLRGPAAARYGSGAAGGVVNIITKRATEQWMGSVTTFTSTPTNSEEGATRRANFNLAGPLTNDLSLRLYGSANKTDADDTDINADVLDDGTLNPSAGREGVRNRDINALLSWQATEDQLLDLEMGYSRQGNIYTGDSQNNNRNELTEGLAEDGAETNRLYRQNVALTHTGHWQDMDTRVTAQYERTRNTRLQEGTAGSGEGRINDPDNFVSNELNSYRLSAEADYYTDRFFDQVITFGSEWNRDTLEDPSNTNQSFGETGSLAGFAPNGDDKTSAELGGVYVEDNIELRPGTIVTPGLRFDHHSEAGSNWSPSLNASQELSDHVTLKAGVARAFKAPNLYQTNPNYLLYSRGNGCAIGSQNSCYLVGNEDLDAETSINKEIGIEYRNDDLVAGLTYFRNDYKDKIVSGLDPVAVTGGGTDVLQWRNAERAVVQGLEGNLQIPLTDSLLWSNNVTYMIESEDRETGDPLSIIPEFTLNSTLDWTINDRLNTQLYWTAYGKQEGPSQPINRLGERTGVNDDSLSPYSIVGFNVGYTFNDHLRGSFGVNNLFDKRLYREGNSSNAGAATYNEPGRAIYSSLTASF
ncbi:ferric enterobactin receptor [Kushneria avicenniae]|uniref:Ferric enterobactin receptor n=1 Tax=Kushneria avicenniae TaxID=402385 RepID=A0A1I1KU38_9GAMM|nr:FepA family TonB-dependent siderophore receptor [Kushneria avicenniae]SFC64306.1 ferric enterobactin receptor [Kushneria avicenniae]